METETFDDKAAFLKALGRGKRSAKEARPNLPRAESTERTGLSTFILKGWNTEFKAGSGYRLWTWDGKDTGYCDTEKSCCEKARGL